MTLSEESYQGGGGEAVQDTRTAREVCPSRACGQPSVPLQGLCKRFHTPQVEGFRFGSADLVDTPGGSLVVQMKPAWKDAQGCRVATLPAWES